MTKLSVFSFKDERLAQSINELYGNTLTPDEANEAATNLRQFFELLGQIDQRNEDNNSEKDPAAST